MLFDVRHCGVVVVVVVVMVLPVAIINYQELRTTTLFFLAVVFVLGSIAGPAVMQDSIMPTGNDHNMPVGMLLRTCQWY